MLGVVAPAGDGGNGRSLPGVRKVYRVRYTPVVEEILIVTTTARVLTEWTPIHPAAGGVS